MPQASASASSYLLSRRRVALAIPLLGSALWAATAKASGGGGQVLKDVSPQAGAEAIFKLLLEEGVLR